MAQSRNCRRASELSLGSGDRLMLAVVDGNLCNRTVFKADPGSVELVARCRKDARLCFPAPEGSRRLYALEHFTPEGVRRGPDRSLETSHVSITPEA